MIVEKQMECRLAGETEVLGENLSQSHFCPSQNPTLPDPGLNPGLRVGKPATNRLSYGAAFFFRTSKYDMTILSAVIYDRHTCWSVIFREGNKLQIKNEIRGIYSPVTMGRKWGFSDII
jgi:hypothetical protein